MKIKLLAYNNFINRIKKRPHADGNADYHKYFSSYSDSNSVTITGINFNPNDGIDTSFTLGGEQFDGYGSQEYPNYDYMLVGEDGTGETEIISRWFIIEMNRNRRGQWRLDLKRDVIIDNFEAFRYSNAFIQRAGKNNSYIELFQKEGINFNQIKTREIRIRDKTTVAWIVGYYAHSDGEGNITELSASVPVNQKIDLYLDGGIETWEYYHYLNKIAGYNNIINFNIKTNVTWQFGELNNNYCQYEYRTPGVNCSRTGTLTGNIGDNPILQEASDTDYSPFLGFLIAYNIQYSDLLRRIGSEFTITEEEVSNLQKQDGKIISYIDNNNNRVTKRIRINLVDGQFSEYQPITVNGELFNKLIEICNASYFITENRGNGQTFQIQIQGKLITFAYEDIGRWELDVPSQRYFTQDSPYDAFAIPYRIGELNASLDYNKYNPGFAYNNITCDPEAAFKIANGLLEQNGSKIYDIQILPYCPFDFDSNNVTEANDTSLYNVIEFYESANSNPTNVGVCFNLSKTQFRKLIDIKSYNPFVTTPEINPDLLTSIDIKIDNETRLYRLTSPNYSSSFEFSVAKNRGLTKLEIECNYKPFNPYIHVALYKEESSDVNRPTLYGADFDDPQGLICRGDYSITRITDNWTEYELANRNYQLIFNRQIESLDFQYEQQRLKGGLGVVTSTLGGGLSGALTGLKFGGPYGAAAGAIIGATAGGVTSGILYSETLKAIQEEKDRTIDTYELQIGSVKARPDTLTSVTGYNINNKYFPLIEVFESTPNEVLEFENYLRVRGMTISRIGVINQYIVEDHSKEYLQAIIYEIPTTYFKDDFHTANEIVTEIQKGVYLEL